MPIRMSLAVLTSATLLTVPAQAQDVRVDKFPIEASPIALEGDARPRQYVGVIGRASAWLGTETGPAELWVHPFKLADAFQLDFRIPDYVDPIRGVDVARTVTTRPELTTITYSHATFTVRQHILAPLDQPGLLVLLDVETFRPLEVIASFNMVFQYAWPGAFGGQYTFWDAGRRAFVLSESRQGKNGVIGSPWAANASSHPAHALPDAPNTFSIPIDTSRTANEFVPIAIVAREAPRDSVFATYAYLLENAAALYAEKRDHATQLLETTTSVDTPDDRLDLATEWAKINLDEQLACNPDLGCGLVAGWGPSGTGTRAGFGWYFGGDAAINTLAMDATGMWPQVAEGLRFLARYQREDGKITHEISQAAGRIPWFTEFPYAFIHADTTPYWIVAVWRYWRASGDAALVRELWPALQRAYAWCLSTETDGDGLIENTTGGLGAIEVGSLLDNVHQDIYLAAVWTQALEAMEDLATFMGDGSTASDAGQTLERASRSLNDRYWLADVGHHAFALDRAGGTNDNLTVWPATAAAFGLLDEERADATLTKLAADAISSDWGAHILSKESALYDPMHYNNGAVWGFVTGFVSWGQYNYRRPWAGYPLVDALAQMIFDWSRGRHPELLSGTYYRPLDTAVPQQFFATSMLLSPLIRGTFGWSPNAPEERATFAPQLPPHWSTARVRRLRVGGTSIDATISQGPERMVVTLRGTGPRTTVDLAIPIPAGAELRSVQRDGEVVAAAQPVPSAHDMRQIVSVPVGSEPTSVVVEWAGGLAVVPPRVDLEPGQTSDGLRILDFRFAGGAWTLTVEGVAGHAYDIDLIGEPVGGVAGGRVVRRPGATTTLRVEFAAGTGRRQTTVRITR